MKLSTTLHARMAHRVAALQRSPSIEGARSVAAVMRRNLRRSLAQRVPAFAEGDPTPEELSTLADLATVVHDVILSGPAGLEMDSCIALRALYYSPEILPIVAGRVYLFTKLDTSGRDALASFCADADGFTLTDRSDYAEPLLAVRRLPPAAITHEATLQGVEFLSPVARAVDYGLRVRLTHVGGMNAWTVSGDALVMAAWLRVHGGAAGEAWARSVVDDVRLTSNRVTLANHARLQGEK